MYISKLSLVNYRNFLNSYFLFNKGINTLIGENGSGKTNAFRAIRLLLDGNFIQNSYRLNQEDFCRKLTNWKGHWIIVSLEFSDVSPDETIQALFLHGSGSINQNEIKRATYNLLFRPKADVRQKLSELKEGDFTGLDALLDSITINDYESYFTGKSEADFSDPAIYKKIVGDFDKVIFPETLDETKIGVKIPHQLSVSKEVAFTFIKALRDVVSDFQNNRRNPLIALLKSQSSEIDEAEYDPISETVKTLNSSIEGLKDVQSIRTNIESTIKETVGETYSPSAISIRSNLSDEAEKLLQSLRLFIGEPQETHEGGIHELSLGGANLIFLTLKLLEYKYLKSHEPFANFLLIEEPEAHIHTHIQKTLFENLDYGDTQIIYSTHSTHISEVSNLQNINVLSKKVNHAEVYQPSTDLPDGNISKLERYLDAVRTNLLFAKGVILVEGDAEEIAIPILVKRVFGISLDELGISLINIRSTGFQNVAQIFHDKRLKRKCAILTDLDSVFFDTDENPEDNDSEKALKLKAIRSQKKGQERKAILDDFATKNDWVSIFYAQHTFEVDFIASGNTREIMAVAPDVYSDAGTKTQTLEELQSGDVALYGKRVLRMANHVGKGWFAVLLGKYLDYETQLPKYILDAVAFAKGSFSKKTITNIVRYRFEKKEIAISSVQPIIEGFEKDGDVSNLRESLSLITNDQQLTDFLNAV